MEDNRDRKIEPVIKGKAKIRKKREIQKIKDVFVQEDINNVKSYVLFDVLIPGIKRIVFDTITNALRMSMFGEKGQTNKQSSSGTKIRYGGYFQQPEEDDRRRQAQSKNGMNYDEITFENRDDAEGVLRAMQGSILQYGIVSVGDLYDFADLPTSNFTTLKYGWKDLEDARVVHVRDGDSFGYALKLPKAVPLQ